ncbi:MAG: hypothetical protein AUJ52_06840 [Elusimicrobia bacterium CG1_02_63_36]|nr:MAG: hypothetical protein AUJ52_06840 [Elusimicrobia bacterium CG1_02_63_36]
MRRGLILLAALSSAGASFAEAPAPALVLRTLVLAAEPAALEEPQPPGVTIAGLPLAERGGLREALSRQLGAPLTEELRSRIVAEVVLHYRNLGYPIVSVTTPPQSLAGGVLRVLVVEGRLGRVRVEGARWFAPEWLRRQIRCPPGRTIDADALAEDLDWINRNPFRQVDLVYAKGSELGRTDVVLQATDRFPVRVYTGYEDSGTPLTSNHRLLAGANWGNAFGLDGRLDYQFMADPEGRFFKAHALTYAQPLPWRHILTLVGSYATVRGDVPDPFELRGSNWQTSARYEAPLPGRSGFRHALALGFDYKRADNNLAFGGESVFGATVDTVQWSLGYNAALRDALGATTLRATAFYSPGGVGARDTDEAYAATRSGASANYAYGRLELGRTTGLPWDFSLVNLLTGQVSGANLIGSEQLGFGGYDTIRGYDTRVVNADQGLILTTELRTPPLSPLSRLLRRAPYDKFQFLAFVGYGVAANKHRLNGEERVTELLGAGPGLRYELASNLTVRADYAWQILALPGRVNVRRWHVGATISL